MFGKIEGAPYINLSKRRKARLSGFATLSALRFWLKIIFHGMRSLRVATWMRANGFPNTQSMAGGIDAWSQEIDMKVPRY